MLTSCQAETAEAKKEDRPKSPSLLAKLLAPFKGEKKEKAEKKPKEKAAKKTEKKEEVCELHDCNGVSADYFIDCRCSCGRGGTQGCRC